MSNNLTVLVRYQTQPGKGEAALTALKELLKKVRQEPNYISIDVCISSTSSNEILLIEKWSDSEYYKGNHMQTEHLQQFIRSSREFLAGPPDISFWEEA